METVTVPRSVCIDGEWFAAHWAVQAVDGGSGELLITAAAAGRDLVLRMDMELARDLRGQAGFDGPLPVDEARAKLAYWRESVEFAERLAVLEDRLQILSDTMRRIVASIDGRLDALEAELETLNEDLETLERQAQGISGVDAGL